MLSAAMPMKQGNRSVGTAARLSVAPMMDWTDRHCRFFHRLMSGEALLYTEMVTAPALVRGGALHLLDHAPEEQPLALQLGGSDPEELAEATRLAEARGFAEVNLNVGCPSDRVQSGCFGAVLMERPALVADCVAAMIAAGLDGIERDLPLEPAITGNAYQVDTDRLPYSLNTALELWEASDFVVEAFGEEVQHHYANMARTELQAFGEAVTDWERFRGFERL